MQSPRPASPIVHLQATRRSSAHPLRTCSAGSTLTPNARVHQCFCSPGEVSVPRVDGDAGGAVGNRSHGPGRRVWPWPRHMSDRSLSAVSPGPPSPSRVGCRQGPRRSRHATGVAPRRRRSRRLSERPPRGMADDNRRKRVGDGEWAARSTGRREDVVNFRIYYP
jgi:hypothetical protein